MPNITEHIYHILVTITCSNKTTTNIFLQRNQNHLNNETTYTLYHSILNYSFNI